MFFYKYLNKNGEIQQYGSCSEEQHPSGGLIPVEITQEEYENILNDIYSSEIDEEEQLDE